MNLPSYPKVYNLGHRATLRLLDKEVIVQEKVDGSQFSFGVIDGTLWARSRRQQVDLDAPNAIFNFAVATARRLFDENKLLEGTVYRGEAFHRAKHNVLTYDALPPGGFVLFDVDRGPLGREVPENIAAIAQLFEVHSVPCLYKGKADVPLLQRLLVEHTESVLGGSTEGIVIKRWTEPIFAEDGKEIMGKIVRESFKEVHRKARDKPNRADIVDQLIASYNTHPRWEKAIQHLRDAGELVGEPKDIGPLVKAIQNDVNEECAEEIGRVLYNHFRQKILRGVVRGFPEFYKARLLEVMAE